MVELATVLAGAVPLSKKTYNDTYRGQVLLEGEETVQAIIKDVDERQLLNELFVGSLALSLDLPVPTPYLAFAPTAKLELHKGPKVDDGRLCFASADVKHPNVSFQMEEANQEAQAKLMEDLKNWQGISSVVAFDTWVANVDRNGGNLLVAGKAEFWLIDHGHCLTGCDWAPRDFVADKIYLNKIADWLKGQLDEKERESKSCELDAIVADILSVRVEACRTESKIESFLSESERDAAEGFLVDRRSHVSKCAKKSIGVSSLV